LSKKIRQHREVTEEILNPKLELKLVSSEINKIKKQTMKNYHATLMFIGLATAMIFTSFFLIENTLFQNDEQTLKSKYFTENLKGDTMHTWKYWNLIDDQPLYVNIINVDSFKEEKIQVIKDAILSEEKIIVENEGLNLLYYKGWLGALTIAGEKPSLHNLPQKIEIISSADEAGDVVIYLETIKDEDGITGFTKSTVEDDKILKSRITIYDVDSLSNEDLSTIIRHEFGHALGLAHSTAVEDLMHPTINLELPYISECNIEALISLYDGLDSGKITCEN